MFSKADLGLGDASKAVSSPAPKPTVAAMTASLPNLQATSEPITPPVGDAPAKDVEETPTGGDQLDSLEILSGDLILPPPLSYDYIPIARFVHLEEAPGPASQEIATECIIEDAGTKDVEASPLAARVSAPLVPTQEPELPVDKIKFVQENTMPKIPGGARS